MATATWTKLAIPALPRSSHSLSVVGGKAYIWGGELEPRRPVDTDMHVVDLATHAYTRLVAAGAPSARVAHTASVVGESIYIFGGRGVPAMAPIDEHGAVHVFHTGRGTWSTLTPTGSPPPRSYHCAVGVPGGLVVHAGCAADGRLRDTWRLDLGTQAWSRMPDAPGVGRGGAALAYAAGRVWRFGGFDGRTEVGGVIDSLVLDSVGGGEWVSTTFGTAAGFARGDDGDLTKNNTPGPRSVAGLHGTDGRLVLMLGEGKPSPTMGHDAAGKFWSDVWVYDKGTWAETSVRGHEGPGARGWFASDAGAGGVVVHGGIDGTNTRLGDGYVLLFT